MEFKGRVVIVTGARQGIGLGIVKKFSKLGAFVVVSDIDLESCKKVCSELGPNCLAVKCDVSNEKDVKALVKETLKAFGRIDVLANNAGVYPFKPFLELDEATWDKTINVNLKGTMQCSREVALQMKKQGTGGKIVNVSSIAAIIGYTSLVHYCASKAGVLGFTRALALELAPFKINVNSVCPGAIDTPGAGMDKSSQEQTIAIIPWKRIGKPEDIANAVVFLASEEADYITGQALVVDGGWTVQ